MSSGSKEEVQQRYHALFDAIDQGFCIIEVLFDPQGHAHDFRFVETNARFEHQTGLKSVLGRTMRELAPEHEARWFEFYGRVALTGKPQRFTEQARALGRWFDVYAFSVGEPGRHHVGVLFHDVTQRKHAEQALLASEARARLAVAIAQLGTWQHDPITGQIDFDARMRQLWGGPAHDGPITAEEVVQRLHPEDRPRVEAAARQALTPAQGTPTEGQYEMDYRVVWPDGTERWLAANGLAQFEGEGSARRATHFMGTALDITERKRVEATLRASEERLRDADLRKNEFLATLAHELRNPLAPIRNSLHVLRIGGNRAETAAVHEMLERQVNHMVRLIDDLMEVSRISRGTIELQRRPLDLLGIVRETVDAARTALEHAHHRLTLDLPAQPLMVNGDAVRLSQVFSNLLNNAIRYTDDGGRLDVRAWQADDMAHVSVRDSGSGIAVAKLPDIFTMFGGQDRRDMRSHSGLGIGLSLAQRLAQLHGGSIEAASEGPGQGSTFTVHLPLAPAPPARRRGAPAPATVPGVLSPSPHPLRVLVVDDNRDAADSTGMLLDFLGCEVKVLYDGAAAVAAVSDWRPDVALLDLGMPGMDGYEVARRIRALPHPRRVTLVALTGWGQPADMQRTREHGFDHHLVKPMNVDVLMALLGSLQRPEQEPS